MAGSGNHFFFLTLLVIVLGMAVLYLLMRNRKQDEMIARVRSHIERKVEDVDVEDITRRFLSSPENRGFLRAYVVPLVLQGLENEPPIMESHGPPIQKEEENASEAPDPQQVPHYPPSTFSLFPLFSSMVPQPPSHPKPVRQDHPHIEEEEEEEEEEESTPEEKEKAKEPEEPEEESDNDEEETVAEPEPEKPKPKRRSNRRKPKEPTEPDDMESVD